MGLVQQAVNSSAASSSSITATFASQPTAGNTIVVIVNNFSQIAVSTVTITNGTSSTLLAHQLDSALTADSEMWGIIAGASSGTTVTVNFASACVNQSLNISEWNGLAATITLDSVAVSHSPLSTSTSAPTGAYSTVTAGDLVIACAVIVSSSNFTGDPTSPYTSFTAPSTAFHCSYNFSAASGSQPTATWTYSPSGNAKTTIVGIQPAASTGGLFEMSLLNGLTTGGPFFPNPTS